MLTGRISRQGDDADNCNAAFIETDRNGIGNNEAVIQKHKEH